MNLIRIRNIRKWQKKSYYMKLLLGFFAVVTMISTLMFISIQFIKKEMIKKEYTLQTVYIDLYIRYVSSYFNSIAAQAFNPSQDYVFLNLNEMSDEAPDDVYISRIVSHLDALNDIEAINFSYILLKDRNKVIDASGVNNSEVFYFLKYYTGYFTWLNHLEAVNVNQFSSISVPLIQSDQQDESVKLTKINYVRPLYDKDGVCFAVLVLNVNNDFLSNLNIADDHNLDREFFLTDAENYIISSNLPFTQGQKININPVLISKTNNSFEWQNKIVSYKLFTEQNDFKLFILTSNDRITGSISQIFMLAQVSLLVITGICILISILIANRMYAPLVELLQITNMNFFNLDGNIKFNELDVIKTNMSRIISHNSAMQFELDKQLPLISEHLIYKLIKNVEWSSSFHDQDDMKGLEFAEGYFSSIILRVVPITLRDLKQDDNETLYVQIYDILHYALYSNAVSILNVEPYEYIIVVYASTAEMQKTILGKLQHITQEYSELSDQYCLIISAGDFKNNINRIGESYQEAKSRYVNRMVNNLFVASDEHTLLAFSLAPEVASSLRNNIVSGNAVDSLHNIDSVLELAVQRTVPVHQYHSLCSNIVALITTLVDETGSVDQDYIDRRALYFYLLENGFHHSLVRNCVEDIAVSSAQKFLEKKQKSRNIDVVLKYIDDHIHLDISLEMAAEVAELTPNYFTRYFKSHTGETFVAYVNRRRVDLAKKIMCETELSIKEIAMKVGCQGSNSFIKLFKKYEGITPGVYKRTLTEPAESRAGG